LTWRIKANLKRGCFSEMLLKLKNYFLRLSIKYKILILFYSIIVITSLVLALFSYTISTNQLKEEVGNLLLRDTKRIK